MPASISRFACTTALAVLALSIASAATAQGTNALDDERPPSRFKYRCDIHTPTVETSFEGCSTPRNGVLSGLYVGFDLGPLSLREGAMRRGRVGPGVAFSVRAGVHFWDHLIVALGIGEIHPNDRAPFTESVVLCRSSNGVDLGCEDDPMNVESGVKAGYLSEELGVHHRFRPWSFLSIAPGAMLGFLHTFGTIDRTITECTDCRIERLAMNADGPYLAPFIRVTFGEMGFFGLIARSQWFLAGDLEHTTMMGAEVGLP